MSDDEIILICALVDRITIPTAGSTRDVWIVYNDRNCGGEGPITVFDNIPGSQSAAGG